MTTPQTPQSYSPYVFDSEHGWVPAPNWTPPPVVVEAPKRKASKLKRAAQILVGLLAASLALAVVTSIVDPNRADAPSSATETSYAPVTRPAYLDDEETTAYTPPPAPVIDVSGYAAADQVYLTLVVGSFPDEPAINAPTTWGPLINMGHANCDLMDAGMTAQFVVDFNTQIWAENPTSPALPAGFWDVQVGASIAAYCPQYA